LLSRIAPGDSATGIAGTGELRPEASMRRAAFACILTILVIGRTVSGQPITPDRPPAAARLADAQEVRIRLGVAPEYTAVRGAEKLKIAVLDYGFDGIGTGKRYLPESAEMVEHYDPAFVRRFSLGDPDYRKSFEPFNRHGRIMAQIVWAVTGMHPGGPKFYLLNANGPTMLRRAVRYAIEQGVDIILFSGSFEGGGDGDGRGPINRIVDQALAQDILWINAAGNYGRRVYNGSMYVLPDGYLRLRSGSDVASLRFRNKADENTVTVTLSWSDYRDEEDAGTDKDLDLFVEDWTGRIIGSGEKVQVNGTKEPGPNESRNPRERFVLTYLAASPDLPNDPDYTYRIRVRARRGKFESTDRVRVLVTATRDLYFPPWSAVSDEAIRFVDATGAEELYPPADNPRVMTVGDLSPSSSIGPTADRRVKPEVLLEDSRAYFTDGEVSAGSSNAAAYFAGIVAVLKAAEPGLKPRHLTRIANEGRQLSDLLAKAVPPRTLTLDTRKSPSAAAPLAMPLRPGLDVARSGLRLWRTPTRERLAEIVRGTR
jgi:subtilisin family serine protease